MVCVLLFYDEKENFAPSFRLICHLNIILWEEFGE